MAAFRGGVPVVLVAAVSANGVIGRDGDMPWRLSTDLKRFKALTIGRPVVLGRKTLESFGGKPLPGRPHVVVTRNADYAVPGAEIAGSLEAAMVRAQAIAAETGAEEVAVIGGGEIYAQAIASADRLYLTHVQAEIEGGDTFFPEIDSSLFGVVEEIPVSAGEKDNYPTVFTVYQRKAAAN